MSSEKCKKVIGLQYYGVFIHFYEFISFRTPYDVFFCSFRMLYNTMAFLSIFMTLSDK